MHFHACPDRLETESKTEVKMQIVGCLLSVLLFHSYYSGYYSVEDLEWEILNKQWGHADVHDTDVPNRSPQQYEPSLSYQMADSEHQKTEALIFNAFPNLNVSAFIRFEEGKVDGLSYSKHAVQQVRLDTADFVIEFVHGSTKEHVKRYTDFGFMEGDLTPEHTILMVIRRRKNEPSRPKHSIATFPKVEHPSSKLYIFNAIWNKQQPDEGLYVYGVHKKMNTDGTEGETITPLVVDLPMNEGKEISVEAGNKMVIKAFYNQIDSVTEFQTGETCVATLANFEAIAGERRYLIAFGNHLDKDHIPQLKSLSHVDITSAAAMTFSSSILYLSMLISTTLT